MKKELKDYINLYLGCEVMLTNGETYILKPSNLPSNWKDLPNPISGKLVLRLIPDITQEELKQLAAWSGTCSPSDWESVSYDTKTIVKHKKCEATFRITDSGDCVSKNSDGWKDFSVSAQQVRIFKQLLDWRFDLFGLIHAGLAINKTTLKIK